MRIHIRRCLWITLIVVVLQLVITLWGVRQQKTLRRSPTLLKQNRKDVPLTGTCNPQLCNPVKDDMLNVHLVAHSHDDVGWLKTLDQYYTGQMNVGTASSYHRGPECVRCVLNTTIPQLLANPSRKFIFIEMSFFSMWWKEIDKKTQDAVRHLIKQRRLEFVIGGWCMSDAATTFYNDIIDQHTLGFSFIDQHFGPCAQSKVAWHVDQFGHSREHSSIFAQMGFDAIVLGRIDHQDQNFRTSQQTLELLWKASPDNLGDKSSLFTHISGGYYAPKGFVMEGWTQNRMKSMDIQAFLSEIELKRQTYKTNHVMIPMGSDFGFRKAGEWFNNMDVLIEKINAMQRHGSKINAMYSTPSCYIHHVNRAQTTWPTKTDDFFPYALDRGYWTGYFTSKGGLKLHTKKAGALLQACKQLSIFAGLDNAFDKTHVLKAAVGVLQHHDAITGTEKEHVVQDYNRMLSEGETQCQNVIDESYQYLANDEPQPSMHQQFCPGLNISMCPVSEASHQMVMFVYNPLSRPVSSWVRLPTTHEKYAITGQDGSIPFQIVYISEATLRMPERKSSAKTEVVFNVQIPAMGTSTFNLEGLPGPQIAPATQTQEPFHIKNKHLEVTFDIGGRISMIKNLDLDLYLPLKQDYGYYESKQTVRPSGAYVFAPRQDVVKQLPGRVEVLVNRGTEMTEVHQKFASNVHQVVRLYKNAAYLELEWEVGPISISDNQGKEYISIFTTDIKSNAEFYTDSNGREMLKRRRNYRETWKLQMEQPISGNYYPVTSNIYIKDAERDVHMTVMTDRCQGGSSLRDGQIELMVHRRTLYDDSLGVGEPLSELGVDGKGLILKGKHYLYIGTKYNSVQFHREKSLEIHFSPTISFVPVNSVSIKNKDTTKTMGWTSLKSSLPANVQILSLDYVEENNTDIILLRLEHFYERGEHPKLSKPATVELQHMFSAFEIVGVEELSLGANFNASQVERLRWRTESGLTPKSIAAASSIKMEFPLAVTLYPMEIRTFHVQVQDKNEDSGFLKNIFR